jgi:hypothetical protein
MEGVEGLGKLLISFKSLSTLEGKVGRLENAPISEGNQPLGYSLKKTKKKHYFHFFYAKKS